MEGTSSPMLRHTVSSGAEQSTAANTSASRSPATPALSQLPGAEPLQQLSIQRQLGFASPVAIPPTRPQAVQDTRSGSPLSPAAPQLRTLHSKSPSFGVSSQASHSAGSGSNSPASARWPALNKSVSHGSNSSSVGSIKATRSISSPSHTAAAAAAAADAAATDAGLASPDSKSLSSPRGQGATWHKSSSFSPRQYAARYSPRVSLKHLQVSAVHNPKPITSPRPSMSPGQRLLFTDDVELTPPPLLLSGSPGAQVLNPQALARMLRRDTSAASGAGSPFAAAADTTSSPSKRRSTSSSVLCFQRAGSSAGSGTYDVAALLGSPGPGGPRPVLNSSPGALSCSSVHSAGSAGKRRASADWVYEAGHACCSPPQQETNGGKSGRSSASSSRRTSHHQPQHQQQQRQGSGNSILDAMSGLSAPVGSLSADQQHGSSLHSSPKSDVEVRLQRRSGSLGVHFDVAEGPADEQHSTLRHGTPYPGTERSARPGDGSQPGLLPPPQQQHHQPAVTFELPGHQEQHLHHKLWHGMPNPDRDLSFAGAGGHQGLQESQDDPDHVQNGQLPHANKQQQQQQQPLPGSPKLAKAVSFDMPSDAAEQEHAALRQGTPYPGRGSGDTGQSHEPGKMYESPSLTDLVRCGQPPEGQRQKTGNSSKTSNMGQSSRNGADAPAAGVDPPASAVVRFDVPADAGAGEIVGEDCTYVRKGTPFPGREDRRLGDEQLSAGVRFLVADPLPAAAAAVTVPKQPGNNEAADKQYTRKATPHPGKLDELTGRQKSSQPVGVHFTVSAGRSSGKGDGTWYPTAGEEHQESNPAVGVRFSVAEGQGAGEVVTDDTFVRKGTPYPGRLDSLIEDQQGAASAGAAVRFVMAEGQGAREVVSDHTYIRKSTPHPGRLDSLTNSPPTAAGVGVLVEQGQVREAVIADHSYTRKGTPYPSRPGDIIEQQAAATGGSAGVRFSVAEGAGAGEVASDRGHIRQGTPHPGSLDSLTDDQSGNLGIMPLGGQGANELQHSVGPEHQIASAIRSGEGRGLIRVRFSVADGREADTEHHFTRQPTPFVREEDINAVEQQQQQQQLVHVKFSLREGLGPGESDGHQHRPVRVPTPFVRRRTESLDLEQPGAVRFGVPDSQGPGEYDHEQHHHRKPTPFVPREERHSGSAGGIRFAKHTDISYAEDHTDSMQLPSSDSSHLQVSPQQQQRRSRSSGSSVHFAAEAGLQIPNSTRTTPRSSSSSPVMQQCAMDTVAKGSDAQRPNTCSFSGHSIGSSKAYSSHCSTGAGVSPDADDNLTYSRGTTVSNCSESPPHTARSTVSSTNSSMHGGRQHRPVVQQQQQQQQDEHQQHYTRKDTPYPLGQGNDDSHDLMLDLLQQELAAVAAGNGQKPAVASPRSASSSVGPSSMRVSRSSTGSSVAQTSLGTQPLRSSMRQSGSNPSRRSSSSSTRHDCAVKLSVTPYIAVVHIPATGGIWDTVNSGRGSPIVPLGSAASGATRNTSPRSSETLVSPGNPLSPTTAVVSSSSASLTQPHHHISAPSNLESLGAGLSGFKSFKSGTFNAPVSEPVLGGSADHAKRHSFGSTGLHSVPETDCSTSYKPTTPSAGLVTSRSEGSWALSPPSPAGTAPNHSHSAGARVAPKLRTTQSLDSAAGSKALLSSSEGGHHHRGILAKAAHAANRLLHKTSSGRHKASGSSPSSPKGSSHTSSSPGKQFLHAMSWMSNKGSPSASDSETHHHHHHEQQQQPGAGDVSSNSVASSHVKPPAAPGSTGSGRKSWEGRGLDHSTSSANPEHDDSSSSKHACSDSMARLDGAAIAGSAASVGRSFVPDGESAVDPAVVALADLFRSGS